MNAERWSRIRTLFERATTLPPEARTAYLDAECGHDASLRAEIDALLAADAEASGFLDRAVADAVREVGSGVQLGQRVGPYVLDRELAHGGMGAVFLGRRADDAYEAAVAIKVIRGVRTGDLQRRFRTERQILASLDHPNIAHLLDGGATGDGVPYLVMEYVDGRPIDTYCDEEGLDLTARIRLFRRVCAAVDHAHHALIIHRDIKPSNVMVTADGAPKLLDFGIAKLLDPTGEGETTTLALMTPSYASPEQILGKPIGVASDVYSLGVLLYRILTGRLPFDTEGTSAATLARQIVERAPPRPSACPGLSAPTARALRGDLDAIVLTALRTEPERRYASPARLSEDLERYLDGRPVTARPDRVTYRAGKFVRRHVAAVATTAAVLIALVALTAFYLTGLRAERDRAELEAARTRKVAAFMGDLFSYANPATTGGREISARQMLDRGTERVTTDLDDDPETQTTLLLSASDAYRELGDNRQAVVVAQRAADISARRFGPRSLEVGRALAALALVVGRAIGDDSALVVARRADSIFRDHPGEDPLGYALALHRLGWLMEVQGAYRASDSMLSRALALQRGRPDSDAGEVASLLNDMGIERQELGDTVGADTLLQQAVALNRALYGPNHPETAIALGNLGIQRELEGRLADAVSLYRQSIEIERRLYGPTYPDEAAHYINLSRVLRTMGRLRESDSAARAALAIDSARGPNHPYVAYDQRVLAAVVAKEGDLAEAERLFRSASRIYRLHYTPDNIAFGTVDEGLGDVLRRTGRPAQAVPLLTHAIALYTKALGPRHLRAEHSRILLGEALTALGRYAQAEPPILDAYQSLAAAARPDTAEVALARRALWTLYVAWKKPEKAKAFADVEAATSPR
ncbi:MAG TPA: serine/threonine-protein kinase [Gemmatimonadales bacterium]|nr:serine/threonine-protein kinase [Gemmatimonadales bacterium]